MNVVERLDDYGKAGWIGVMIVAFIVFWPLGLMILGFLIWSGRMGRCGYGGAGRWYYGQGERQRGRRRREGLTGNTAFDEYRRETLDRLEQEQKEFVEFLDRLRQAKDKTEFDQFMAEQRRRPASPQAPEDPAPAT